MAAANTIQDQLKLAVMHHQAGRLAEAEKLYRQILAQRPHQVDALHLLGMLAYQVGRHQLAVDLIQQAIAKSPRVAAYHSNLGAAQAALGKMEDAIVSYQSALAIEPGLAEAHNNLGSALLAKDQVQGAMESLHRALAIKPDYVEALSNLGVALQSQDRMDEAIDCYRRALAADPRYVKALSNLGGALTAKGRPDEGIAVLRRALEVNPDFAESHNNMGNALHGKGLLDEAIGCFRHALMLKPDMADAHNNLGNALKDKGLLDEALIHLRRALEIQPRFALAHNNLSNALKDAGLIDEAIDGFRRAQVLQPNAARHSNVICTLQYSPRFTSRQILEEARHWNNLHAQPLQGQFRTHDNSPDPERRLRIGYISPDFHFHPVGNFLGPILRHRDRASFEVFCYSNGGRTDAVTARLRDLSDGWRPIVGQTDQQAADLIRSDGIDILVDLALHTANNRLLVFARRPAPVQVTYMGYPNTTGMTAIDYRLTDPHLDPPGLYDADYSEQSIRLRDTFWCYDPLTTGPEVQPLPAQSAGHITFGSLNNYCKVNEGLLQLWSRVLRAMNDSRMLILAPEGRHRQLALEIFQRQGVDPGRIEWFNRSPRLNYLAGYHRIDIGLDTLPYNGHTTSLDSFWMGVPVITLQGQTVVGRGGVSQLMNLGLPELIARTPDEFTAIAADLAADLPRVAELRRSLRSRMESSPLMNAPRFVENLESIYRSIWQRWCEGRVAAASRQ